MSQRRSVHPDALSPRRQIAGIAVPVSLESVLQLVLQFANQVVVGALGATAIAAVGLANSLTLVATVSLGAVGASASILVARAYGAGRRHDLDRSVSLALLLAAAAATVVAVVVATSAPGLLRMTGAPDGVVATGAPYLRVAAVTVVPAVLSLVLSGVLRSLGRAQRSMVVTLVTVAANTGLAVLLVFGVGPLPQLGVAGAAWATLISTTVKLGLLLATLYRPGGPISWVWPDAWGVDLARLRPVVVLAVPLGLTSLLWSTGTFLYTVIGARLGDQALAAVQIVTTLEGVFLVGSLGLSSATTALVGRSLGRGDGGGAQAWVSRLTRAGRYTALTFGGLFAVSSLLLGVLFSDVDDRVRHLATIGILINAAFQLPKVHNMVTGVGVLPSGGDTRGVIAGDTISAFGVGLPLAVLLALHTPLGVVGVFVARVVEELVKMAIFHRRADRLAWLELALAHRPTVAAES